MKVKNHVWVEYPKMYDDEIQMGSIILKKDVSYKPDWNKKLHGIITHLAPQISNALGIQDDLEVGDKIYFHYLVSDEDHILEVDGKKYLRVPVYKIFCYVRDGQITAFGGYVLAKPLFDDDIEDVEVEGKKIKAKMSESGLVTSLEVDHRKNVSVIHHIGKPLADQPELDCKAGDQVFMLVKSEHRYEIEGVEYFIYEQENITAVLEEVSSETVSTSNILI